MNIPLLFLFWLMWFFNFSSRTILSPLLPIFENELGMSHTLSGSLFVFVSAGFTLSLLAAGWLGSRFGPKKAIAAANTLFIVALILLRFGNSYAYVAAVAFFLGLGTGLYLPSAVPILTSTFRQETWGRVFAFHETASSFSFLAIPLLTAISLRFFDWESYLLVFAGAFAIVTLIFLSVAPAPPVHKGSALGYSRLLVRKEFWIMAALWCAAGASVLAIFNITPLLLVNERGVPLETANTILGVSRTGGVVATFLVGFLVDRYGPRRMLFVSIFFTGLCTLVVGLSQNLFLLVAALFFQAVFSLIFFPIGLVAVSRLTAPSERSLFTGAVATTSVIFGSGLTPFVMAAAGDVWSFQGGILILGVLVTSCCLLLIPLRGLEN
jgi:MFS transporter, NNP family, nitrate/nitrite transporter